MSMTGLQILSLIFALNQGGSWSTVYPAPERAVLNDRYTVEVRSQGSSDWTDVPVYEVRVDLDTLSPAAFAAFDFFGSVDVRVTFNDDLISQAEVRPRSKGIEPVEVSDTVREFTLTEPCNLSFEVNGDVLQNLHLFANPPEVNVPSPHDPDVIYFGPGYHTVETDPSLITHLGTNSEGKVRAEVQIPSNKTLYLAGGAVLQAAIDIDQAATNVTICGRGIVDMSYWNEPDGLRNPGVTWAVPGIDLSRNTNVVVRDIIVKQPTGYVVNGGSSSDITIENLKGFTSQQYGDGIDMMSCSNVVINGVFLRTSDDSVAVYGGRWGYDGDSVNWTVSHSVLWADVAHPIFIGVHGRTNLISDLTFRDIDILENDEDAPSYYGAMAVGCADDNICRDITFDDIRVEHIRDAGGLLVHIDIRNSDSRGQSVENIVFRDIVYSGPHGSAIDGYSTDRAVDGVHFDNLMVNGTRILSAEQGDVAVGDYAYNVTFGPVTSLTYQRTASGNWHDTNSAWKVGGQFVSTLPYASDSVTLLSAVDGIVSLADASVFVDDLSVGLWDAALSKQTILDVQTNLTVSDEFKIAASELHPGNGEVRISGATVSARRSTFGTSSNGFARLQIDDDGTFTDTVGSCFMYARSAVTVEQGLFSVNDALVMESGAMLNIDHDSAVRVGSAANLDQYIDDGWIAGDSVDENVQVSTDGGTNVLRVALKALRYNNPGLAVPLTVGTRAQPLPMDYDGDGDMDLVVASQSTPYGGVYFFENTSGDDVPVFAAGKRLLRKLVSPRLSYINGEPRVVVAGAELKDFKGSLDRKETPFGIPAAIAGDYTSRADLTAKQWLLVDYEDDGDLDVIIGSSDKSEYNNSDETVLFDENGVWQNGPLHGYVNLIENTGSTYVDQGRIEAGGVPIDTYGMPGPCFGDFDGDSDLDIICGEQIDQFYWIENTGSRSAPVYAAQRKLANSGGLIQGDNELIFPVAVDWDQDGDDDLVFGDSDGRVAWLENTGSVSDNMPIFASPVYFRQEADAVTVGSLVTPYSTDWDDDGDEDLICGTASGYVRLIENLGGAPARWAAPVDLVAAGETIRFLAGENGSVQGPAEAKWGYTTLSVVDWDGDELKDLIVNSIRGDVVWYKNIGTVGSPRLAAQQSVKVDWDGQPAPKPAWTWWTPEENDLCTQWRTTPYAIDWNEDGLMDLIMLDHDGFMAFYERVERNGELFLTPGQRIFYSNMRAQYNSGNGGWIDGVFVDPEPGLMQFNAEEYGGSGRRKFTFTDWDDDGDLDLIANALNAALFENTGVADGIVYFDNLGSLSNVRLTGHTTSPAMLDWDGDGDQDLLIGAEDGRIYIFEK